MVIILLCLTSLSISNMLMFLCNPFILLTEYELTCKFEMLVIEKIMIFPNKLFFQTLILLSEVVVECFIMIYAFLVVVY